MFVKQLKIEGIMEVNIPTGTPLVYELDKDLKPVRNYYLGNYWLIIYSIIILSKADENELKAKMESVAN